MKKKLLAKYHCFTCRENGHHHKSPCPKENSLKPCLIDKCGRSHTPLAHKNWREALARKKAREAGSTGPQFTQDAPKKPHQGGRGTGVERGKEGGKGGPRRRWQQ